MKAAHNNKVRFHIMSMEEPDEANAEELKTASENSIIKLGLMTRRKETEVTFRHVTLS